MRQKNTKTVRNRYNKGMTTSAEAVGLSLKMKNEGIKKPPPVISGSGFLVFGNWLLVLQLFHFRFKCLFEFLVVVLGTNALVFRQAFVVLLENIATTQFDSHV